MSTTPKLDRVDPAGEAVAAGYNGCTLLADGRVLLVPCSATSPSIYDPRADTLAVSAAATPAELQTGMDFAGGALLADGRVLLLPGQNGDLADCRIWDAAADTIARTLREFYRSSYESIYMSKRQDVEKAVAGAQQVYRRNVFPEMNVQFGTYPNNIGHMDFPGCFRCHDDNHKTKDGRKIGQDCDSCHDFQ